VSMMAVAPCSRQPTPRAMAERDLGGSDRNCDEGQLGFGPAKKWRETIGRDVRVPNRCGLKSGENRKGDRRGSCGPVAPTRPLRSPGALRKLYRAIVFVPIMARWLSGFLNKTRSRCEQNPMRPGSSHDRSTGGAWRLRLWDLHLD
jgi:hypothetical protein